MYENFSCNAYDANYCHIQNLTLTLALAGPIPEENFFTQENSLKLENVQTSMVYHMMPSACEDGGMNT